jgi:hypothetical protein
MAPVGVFPGGRPVRQVLGQSYTHSEIGDFSWYTVYIILIDNLISFAFIWFFWTTPFFQRALCTGKSRLWIARNLSASNRMAIGLFFTTLKIQAVSYINSDSICTNTFVLFCCLVYCTLYFVFNR